NNANEFSGRVDHNFRGTNTVFFRYSFLDGTSVAPGSQHAASTSTADNRNFGGGYTHTFRPNLLLDAALGYSGRFNAVTSAVFNGVPAGSNDIFSNIQNVYGFQNFSYTGYNGIGGSGPAGSE